METKEASREGAAAGDARLREFIAAWKEEVGEELSEGDARIRLLELVEFYCLIAKEPPLPQPPAAGSPY